MATSITILDVFIMVGLAIGMGRGFATGLIQQVASVVGLLVSFALALQLMQPIGELATNSLGIATSIAPLIGFVLSFVAVYVAMYALAKMIESLVGKLHLSTLNRAAGALLGGFKAALALSVLFLVLSRVEVPSETAQQQSSLYAPVASVLPTAWDAVAEAFPHIENISEAFGERIREQLPDG